MTGLAAVFSGTLLGGAMAAGVAAVTAILGTLAARGGGVPVRAAFVTGPGLRMMGALFGVGLGVFMEPPSLAAFVIAFLAVYLAAQAVLIFRFGQLSDPARTRR